MLSGHAEEAKGTAERLKAIENFQDDDVWVKKIEALSFLGDDQGALEAFEGAQKANALEDSPKAPFIYHLAAVASFRMGREEEARRYWKQSLRLDPTFSLAKENLEDLKNPVGERNGAWPFDLTSWIPRRTIEDIASTMRAGGKDEKSAARRIMRNHPEIDQIIPALLDRGDPHGREFALRLARMLETPAMLTALRDFALGQRGSDQQRHLAAQTASQAGLLPTGQARMWLNGEWQEIFLIGIQIHGEAQDRFKPQTERLLIEAGMAYREFDGKRAEQLYKQALELEPDSIRIMNNVAGAYSMQGRTEEAKALIWKIHERDPDYLFARTSLSKFLVEEGKLDQAEEMLRPLLERRRMHHSEFGSFCDAWINLNVARGKDKEAVAWLQIWEGMGEEHPILEVWQRKLKKKRSRFR
jgi:tetratricopeptide (TPR) repeat protein